MSIASPLNDLTAYDAIGRLAHIGCWRHDIEQNHMSWTDEMFHIHGIEQVSSIPSKELMLSFALDEHVEALDQFLEDAATHDGITHYFYSIKDRKNNIRHLKCTTESKRNTTNKLVVTGVLQDITSQHETEAELRDSKAFLKLVMEKNPDLIFVKDESFRIVEANEHFISVYPEDMREHIIGYTTLEKYPKKEVDEFLERDRQAFKKGYSEITETVTFPDGKVRTVFTQKIRFHNAKNEVFILGLSRDVTERESLVKQLMESNEELQRFAYICSHDLQEPLRMIQSFSMRLEQHLEKQLQDDAKAQRYFHFLKDGAMRGQQLINDILKYSKISNDDRTFSPVNMNKIIDQVTSDIVSVANHERASITTDPLPEVMGNETQLYQLILNLVSNGLKYQSGASVATVHVTGKEAADHWAFSITDNGIGIEPRHQEKIFNVFQRLHRRDEYPGTGIGLAVCKRIVERHGGTITLSSEKGRGTTFNFTIHKGL